MCIYFINNLLKKAKSLHLIAIAVTWLKYCRYGGKLYSINQSINTLCSVFIYNVIHLALTQY